MKALRWENAHNGCLVSLTESIVSGNLSHWIAIMSAVVLLDWSVVFNMIVYNIFLL